MFQNSPWPWLPLFHTAQNPDPISLQTWWTGIFMKHTPARGKAHRPVLGESAGLATGPCKKTPGGTHCVGRASPFGPHPWKEKRDFLGGPVVKTLCFHCRARGFHLWLGKIPHAAWHGQKKKERGFPIHLPPTQTPLFTVPVTSHLFISFPTKCSHPPRTYPTPHFSKHKPNPFPPPWIPSGSSQHCRSLLGKYSPSFFLVCNGACMYAL